MKKDSFLVSANLFVRAREGFIRRLSAVGESEDIIYDIKFAMGEGACTEEKEAIVRYLNALIGSSNKICRLVEHVCGNVLFQKLVAAGLKKV